MKTYFDHISSITAKELLEGLLGYGMFADQLPPIFSSEQLYAEYASGNYIPLKDNTASDYIRYETMRNTGYTRSMGIPEPSNYIKLCQFLSDHWNLIIDHFRDKTDNGAISFNRIHIRKMVGTNALFKMNYSSNEEKMDAILKFVGRKYRVKADISKCFPSIYSHALTWALVGKEKAKQDRNDKSKWYNEIDAKSRSIKYNETNGLLIGPVTSNVLSELILVCVDKELHDKKYEYFRCIDDFEFYTDSYDRAEKFLLDLSAALKRYDLQLNDKKTELEQFIVPNLDEWLTTLKSMMLNGSEEGVALSSVQHFLGIALKWTVEMRGASPLKYAIKKLCKNKLTSPARTFLYGWLKHIMTVYPYVIKDFEDHVFKAFSFTNDEVKEFALIAYDNGINTRNYESCVYALYWLLRWNIDFGKNVVDDSIKSDDSLFMVLSYKYTKDVQNHGNAQATDLKPLKTVALGKINDERYWLFFYEVLSKSLLPAKYKAMKEKGITFLK